MTEYLRPDGDVALDGWTDHADGTTNIYQALDETSAGDSDFVQSPAVEGGSADLTVRLIEATETMLAIGSMSGTISLQWGDTGFQKLTQSFIADETTVSAVRVKLQKNSLPADGVQLKIFSADGSHKPDTQVGVTSNVIAYTAIPVDPSFLVAEFIFAPPVPVTNGVEYCFVIERTGAVDGFNNYSAVYDTTASYTSGYFHFWTGSTWSATYSTAFDVIAEIDFSASSQIAEWTHTDIADTFADAEQTLTTPQFEAITDFTNLFIEMDDTLGSVYRFALGDPAGSLADPVVVRYRYKKLVEEGGEEPDPSNLLLGAKDFSDAAWEYAGATVAVNVSITDPDGAELSDQIIEDTSTGIHAVYQTVVKDTTVRTYNLTVYVRQGLPTGRFRVRLQLDDAVAHGQFCTYDMDNAVVDTSVQTFGTDFSGGSPDATGLANDWVLCELNGVVSGTGTTLRVLILLDNQTDGASNISYAGETARNIFVYNARLVEVV